MSIKCGNCKHHHETVAAVKACYGNFPADRPFQGKLFSTSPVSPSRLAEFVDEGEDNGFRDHPTTSPKPRVQEPPADGVDWAHVTAVINHSNSEDRHPSTKGATERQINFANSLLARRVHPTSYTPDETWTRFAIGELITALIASPVKLGKDQFRSVGPDSNLDIPAGRYAVETPQGVRFYKVDRPTEGRWAGYVFVKIQAGDEFHKVPAARGILNEIAEQGVKECHLRYGRELGKCGRCGRTLTNDESRAYGIGPDCREILGW